MTRKDGREYEPLSLGTLQAGLDRYLREQKYPASIIKYDIFLGSRDVLKGRANYNREKLGMGRKPNRSRSLSLEDEVVLWNSKQLDSHTSKSLINTVWFLLTQHFGMRGRPTRTP